MESIFDLGRMSVANVTECSNISKM